MAQILGLRELQNQLKSLQKEMGQNLLRKVARQGAALARDEARKIAPFTDRTGVGRKSIITSEKRAPAGVATFLVGFRRSKKRSGFYIRFIEGGAQKHVINRAGANLVRFGENKGQQRLSTRGRTATKVLAIDLGGTIIFRRSVLHPGITAKPFLGQALRNAHDSIVKNTELLINEAVHNVAK